MIVYRFYQKSNRPGFWVEFWLSPTSRDDHACTELLSAAAVMDQIDAKLENSKTISGVVAQSVRALPSQHLRNSESGFQNLTSNLSWPGVGRDHRCRWMHFSADIEQNLMGSGNSWREQLAGTVGGNSWGQPCSWPV